MPNLLLKMSFLLMFSHLLNELIGIFYIANETYPFQHSYKLFVSLHILIKRKKTNQNRYLGYRIGGWVVGWGDRDGRVCGNSQVQVFPDRIIQAAQGCLSKNTSLSSCTSVKFHEFSSESVISSGTDIALQKHTFISLKEITVLRACYLIGVSKCPQWTHFLSNRYKNDMYPCRGQACNCVAHLLTFDPCCIVFFVRQGC